jgi:MYXO-CTERM domain-containing protein
MDRILHKLVGPVGLLLGIGLADPAAAQVDISLSASAPRVTLTDMTPEDGIAPAIRWHGYSRHLDNLLMADRYGESLFASYTEAPEDGSISWESGWNNVMDARAQILPRTDGLAGARVDATAERGGDVEHYANARAWVLSNFELAPHTTAWFQVDLVLALHALQPENGWDGGSVLASAAGYFSDSAIYSYDRDSLLEWVGPDYVGYKPGVDKEAVLDVLLVNYTDDWAAGQIAVDIMATAQNMPAPVPELPGWAMAGAGLLVLLRRRRLSPA